MLTTSEAASHGVRNGVLARVKAAVVAQCRSCT